MEIILSDGTEIKNLRLNGNNFVSETEISEDMFKGKLSHVIVKENGEIIQELHHAELVQIALYDDGYYFILRELSDEELYRMKVQSDIEYIAMMTDVDLEV